MLFFFICEQLVYDEEISANISHLSVASVNVNNANTLVLCLGHCGSL